MPPRNSSTRNSALAAARLASARSVPAISMPMPANATVPTSSRRIASTTRPLVLQPSARPVPTMTIAWHDLDDEHGQRLRREQPAARQRRRAEALQHAVAPFVAGRDPEAHHRRRHHREREHAGHEEVDRVLDRVDRVDLREEHQDPDRDHERHDQALAAADREQELDARLTEDGAQLPRGDGSRRDGLRGDGARGHDRPSPVSRRNTSSSERRPVRSSPMRTPWSRSHDREVGDELGRRGRPDHVLTGARLAHLRPGRPRAPSRARRPRGRARR